MVRKKVAAYGPVPLTEQSVGAPGQAAQPSQPARRVAVLLFHGMGRQRRFFTLAELTDFMCRVLGVDQARPRMVTHRGRQNKQSILSATVATRGGQQPYEFTLMEAYWAPLGRSRSNGFQTLAWLFTRLSSLIYKYPGLNPQQYSAIPQMTAALRSAGRGGEAQAPGTSERRLLHAQYWRQAALTARLMVFVGLLPLALILLGGLYMLYATVHIGAVLLDPERYLAGHLAGAIGIALALALAFSVGKGVFFIALTRNTADERDAPAGYSTQLVKWLKALAAVLLVSFTVLNIPGRLTVQEIPWLQALPGWSADTRFDLGDLPYVGGALQPLQMPRLVWAAEQVLPYDRAPLRSPLWLAAALIAVVAAFVALLVRYLGLTRQRRKVKDGAPQAEKLDNSARITAFWVLALPSLAIVGALFALALSQLLPVALVATFYLAVVMTLGIYILSASQRGYPSAQFWLMLGGGLLTLAALTAAVGLMDQDSRLRDGGLALAVLIAITGHSLSSYVLRYVVDYLGDVAAFMTDDENESEAEIRQRIVDCGVEQLELVCGIPVAPNDGIVPRRFDGEVVQPDEEEPRAFDKVIVMAHSLGTAVAFAALCQYYSRLVELDSVGAGEDTDRVERLKLAAFITFGSPLDVLRMIFEPLPSHNRFYDLLRLYGLQLASAKPGWRLFENVLWENWYNDFDVISSNVEMYGEEVKDYKLGLKAPPIANHGAYLTAESAVERMRAVLQSQLGIRPPGPPAA